MAPRRSVHGWTEVENTPHTGAPRLPRTRPDGQAWHDLTRDRWRAWSTMPHARLWHASDWEFANTAALIADEFYRTGKAALATELRHWERVMGTTADARQAQRIVYVEPKPKLSVVPAPTPVDDYRDL